MDAVVLHGSFNSRKQISEYWIPHLECLFDKILFPEFPVEDFEEMSVVGEDFVCKNQSLNSWLNVIDRYIPEITSLKQVMFICHSTSPLFFLHFINRYDINIENSLFVSPFINELSNVSWQIKKVNDSFYSKFDYDKIHNKCGKSTTLLSDNDPYVDKRNSVEFANFVGSEIIVVSGLGHFNKVGSGEVIANVIKKSFI